MPGLYTLVATRVDGETLTAAKYNADEQNHIDNQELQKTDDFSASVAQMQTTADPGESGTESLATDASGELARLRFAIKDTKDALGTAVAQWYSTPGTISGLVATQGVRNLTLNGDLEDWRDGTAVAPFGWVLSGAGASVARDGTNFKTGTFAASVTRAGTDAILQRNAIAEAGGQAYIRSRAYRLSAWVRATVASRVRIRINDGVGSTFSAYHTGGGAFERLSVTRTLDATATALNVGLSVDTGDTNGQIDTVMLTDGTAEVAFVRRGVGETDDRMSVFTSSATFGVPEAVTEVTVLVVAAGGGGGSGGRNAGASEAGGGGGGGAGESLLLRHPVTPSTVLTVTIGALGTGGAAQGANADGNPGTAGGDSVFDTITARGGGGGGGGVQAASPSAGGSGGRAFGAAGGAGGGGGVAGANTDAGAATSGGTGGQSAGSPTTTGGGGAGGNSIAGKGGDGSAGNSGGGGTAAGSAATLFGSGGGGSGGAVAGGSSGAGGNGTAGLVIVWW